MDSLTSKQAVEQINGKLGVKIEQDKWGDISVLMTRNGYQWSGGTGSRELLSMLRSAIDEFLGVAVEPSASVAPMFALEQYRCQPEKQTYCLHMDTAHMLLAAWLKAWDAGSDNENLYARTRDLLAGRASQPPSPSEVRHGPCPCCDNGECWCHGGISAETSVTENVSQPTGE